MLAIEIEYLMGRVLASTHNERRMAEWPPHPQKLFSALVAAYEECDLGSDARAALEWMEALRDPPQIYAQPPDKEGWGRDVSYVFVPVNDSEAQFKKNKIKKKLYPLIADGINLRRNRQPRQFPAFSPSDRHVWFIWKEAPDQDRHKPAIQRIAENVTYLGHPMSPVRMRICDSPPKPTLIPNPNGHIIMRLPGVGRLKHLEEIYKLRLKNESIRC